MVLPIPLHIASRSSKLAKLQVEELLQALQCHYPQVQAHISHVKTHGDLDLKQSLRTMGKTDFFTREVDQCVIEGRCDIAVHSAKDLPERLPEGLSCIALTRCIDSRDSLVLRHGMTLEGLPCGARIAASSIRREETVRALRSDLVFIDVRGTIEERLKLIEKGQVDGVIVARAALLRLGLIGSDRVNETILPGETTPLQGQLAVVARHDRPDLRQLFACLDVTGREDEALKR